MAIKLCDFENWANNILSRYRLTDTEKSSVQQNYKNIFGGADVLDNEKFVLNSEEEQLANNYIENAINIAKQKIKEINYSRQEFGLNSPNISNLRGIFNNQNDAVYNKSIYDEAINQINSQNVMDLFSDCEHYKLLHNRLRTAEELYNDTLSIRNALIEKAKSLGLDTTELDKRPITKYSTDALSSERVYNEPAINENRKLLDEYIKLIQAKLDADYKAELKNEAQRIKDIYNSYPIKEQDIDSEEFGDFKQGNARTCGILSTLKSAISTENGKQKVHKMLQIDKNNDGSLKSITVTIQGKKYCLDAETLKNDTFYSQGDLRIKAIEMAVVKWTKENSIDMLYGWDANNGYHILFGDAQNAGGPNLNHADSCYIESLQKNPNMKGTAGNGSKLYSAFTEKGEKVPIAENHSYSVLKADSQYVYISNPWNSSVPLKMYIEDFKKCFRDTSLFDYSL